MTCALSWAGAVGVDGDGAPLVPESMMGIAEITNTVTAAEVLLLAQDGRIDLDGALSTYLDSPVLSPLLSRGTKVRQALSHTSGIPDYATQNMLTALRGDPTRSWTAEQALSYAPTVTHPRFPDSVSMSDYLLIGLLIENVTGVGYAKAVHRDLLSGNGDERIVVQDAQLPSPPLAAPDDPDDLVPDGHFLPNRAVASGHPGFLIPGYQALLLVVPHDQLSVAVLTAAPGDVGAVETPIIVADLIDALHS